MCPYLEIIDETDGYCLASSCRLREGKVSGTCESSHYQSCSSFPDNDDNNEDEDDEED